jgi:hypothetical protein
MRARLPLTLGLGLLALGCENAAGPCQVGPIDYFSPYLVQLRPRGSLPAECPQGQQYQVLFASVYGTPGSTDPISVAFQFPLSRVDPASGAQAQGRFNTLLAPSSGVCTIDALTPATDDAATPTNAPNPVGATTYAFSSMEVHSDAVHQGKQLQARAVVDYGIPACSGLEYVAQAVFPLTPCLNDSVCLPDAVLTDLPPPAGRGYGSSLNPDYRVFCNRDPALLNNEEVVSVLGGRPDFLTVGPDAYHDPNDGSLHDVGVCFFSEPFPSLCPAGSTLSTSGPCVVGPGSNPH